MNRKIHNVNIQYFFAIVKLKRPNNKAQNLKFVSEFCFAKNFHFNFETIIRHQKAKLFYVFANLIKIFIE